MDLFNNLLRVQYALVSNNHYKPQYHHTTRAFDSNNLGNPRRHIAAFYIANTQPFYEQHDDDSAGACIWRQTLQQSKRIDSFFKKTLNFEKKMKGSLERLEEYEKFFFKDGRCASCDFPVNTWYLGGRRIECANPKKEKKKHVLKCERPTCPGQKQPVCCGCATAGCKGCMVQCPKCPNLQCYDCIDKFSCEICIESEFSCHVCVGPLKPWCSRAMGREPKRQLVCTDCYDEFEIDEAVILQRTCAECAKDYPASCIQPGCSHSFCAHKEPGRKFCDKHLAGPSNNKKAKNDKDQ